MKSISGIVIGLILVLIFGRFIPLVLLALLLVLPLLIIKDCIEEGKFL